MALTIEQASADSPDAVRLMTSMWAELDEIYGNLIGTPSRLAGMEKPGAAFIIARNSERTVGCAALRPMNETTAEVKRMYVEPGSRKQGVARAMMHALEQLARAARFSEIWLETGLRQPGAIRLYESLGYKRIAAFGDYRDDPVSVCFGRPLI